MVLDVPVNTTNFTFGTNGKLIVLGVPVYNNIKVENLNPLIFRLLKPLIFHFFLDT